MICGSEVGKSIACARVKTCCFPYIDDKIWNRVSFVVGVIMTPFAMKAMGYCRIAKCQTHKLDENGWVVRNRMTMSLGKVDTMFGQGVGDHSVVVCLNAVTFSFFIDYVYRMQRAMLK